VEIVGLRKLIVQADVCLLAIDTEQKDSSFHGKSCPLLAVPVCLPREGFKLSQLRVWF
jgi:hypothetical protein